MLSYNGIEWLSTFFTWSRHSGESLTITVVPRGTVPALRASRQPRHIREGSIGAGGGVLGPLPTVVTGRTDDLRGDLGAWGTVIPRLAFTHYRQ